LLSGLLCPQGYDSTVDLLGEQSVQMTAIFETAIVLVSALLALLLAARFAQAVRPPVALALVPQQCSNAVISGGAQTIVGVLLERCLPSRAPPDLSLRLCPSPPGVRIQ
jgi:hypothetical protein